MRGWAGKKKSKKSQLEKSKKSQKKVKCADPSFGGLLEATKSQKKVKKKSKVEKVKKKSKKKSKKSQFCSRLWGRTGLGTWDSGVATRATRDRAGLGLKRPWDSGWGWVGVLRLWGRGLGLEKVKVEQPKRF